MKSGLKKFLFLLLTAISSSFLSYIGTHHFAPLTMMEHWASDIRTTKILPPEDPDTDMLIVAITEQTLEGLTYRSPVDRGFLNNLLKQLQEMNPKVIELDILFDKPTEPEKDAALKETIANYPIPLAISYVDDSDIVTPEQLAYERDFVPVKNRVYATLNRDPTDGVVRKIFPGKLQEDGTYIPSFARGVAAMAGVQSEPVEQEIAWSRLKGKNSVPVAEIPAHNLTKLPPQFIKKLIENKVILVGEIVSLTDRHPTPFGSLLSGSEGQWAGIEIEAQEVRQILHGRHTRNVSLGFVLLSLVIVGMIGAWIGSLNLGAAKLLGALMTLLILLWVGAFVFFRLYGVMFVLISPTLSLLLSAWGSDALTGREAKKQREFINGAFARYLNPQLVKQLADDPNRLQLGGEMREMTLLFCDIRGFTTISEKFDAHGLTRFVNRFLTPMTDIILQTGGTIDKYMGDCIMAFWNAPLEDPNHGENSAKAALMMREKLIELNHQWHKEAIEEGTQPIQVNIGIGLNTGIVCVGNVGSDQRFDYSVLGDDVNLASRLEGQSKTYHLDVVIGERTADKVPHFALLELDMITVKGKTQPVRIFTLVGDEKLKETPEFKSLADSHQEMLIAYRQQNWALARQHLEICRTRTIPLMSGFYDLYEERITFFEQNSPGPEWDGVFVSLSK